MLDDELEDVAGLESEDRALIVATIAAAQFRGPLPPPDVLKAYGQVIQDGPERILAMAERQSSHRQKQEAALMDLEQKLQLRGQLFAFILSFLVIAAGVVLIFLGRPVAGFITLIATLAALVSLFIYGRWKASTAPDEPGSYKRGD